MTHRGFRLYLAGPMRSVAEFNFPAFDAAGKALMSDGYDVFSPAQNDRDNGFEGIGMTGNESLAERGFDMREAISQDLAWITQFSQGICVLPGWEKSAGANAEVATAHALDIPVGPLEMWLDDSKPLKNHPLRIRAPRPPSADAPDFLIPGLTVGGHGLSQSDIAAINHKLNVKLLSQYPTPEESFARVEEKLAPDLPNFAKGGYIAAHNGPIKVGDTVNIWPIDSEIRSVSSTGAEKGVKLARHDLIPTGALNALATHYGVGSRKYADSNWRKGYEWSKSYAAMQRHLTAWWGGEDIDAETGSSHMAAVAWHAFTLLTFIEEHPKFDDRYVAEAAA